MRLCEWLGLACICIAGIVMLIMLTTAPADIPQNLQENGRGGVVLLWNRTYTNASWDVAFGVAADDSGRIFVAGHATGVEGSHGDSPDWLVMALNASDGASLWNVTYSNASEETAFDVAVDTSGRVFVVGFETGVEGGHGDSPDWRIMALDAADGASLWNVTYSNAFDDMAWSVAADTAGRVFVAGHETGIEEGSKNPADWRIMALDAADGTSLWNRTYSSTSEDWAFGVAADTSGRVFVVGLEQAGRGDDGPTTDWRIMALDAADGASLWNVTYSNASHEYAWDVAADNAERIFVVGFETGVEGGHGNSSDWRIMALDAADGASLWNVTYSNALEDVAYGVAADGSGHVFVVGLERAGGGDGGPTEDWRIMALNAADGASLWNVTFSNASNDAAKGVATDASGRVFVVGYEDGVEGGHGDTRDWRIMALQQGKR